jgi:hypothetical protein
MFSQLMGFTGLNKTIDLFKNKGKLLVSARKYKLYSVNSTYISNSELQQPECQRLLDSNQVDKIYNYQIEHYNTYGDYFFTNPITLGLLDNKYYIIDGQHRLKCIQMLNCKGHFDILINILELDTQTELDQKYIAINQNKPIPLPENIDNWKSFGKQIEIYIREKFSKYMSNTEKPNAPNFNMDKLTAYINDNKIADKLNNNYHAFITELESLNTFYRNTYTQTMLPNFNNNIIKHINKSKDKQPTNPFFLSMYKNYEWVDRIVYKLNNNLKYEEMEHVSCENRKRIKKKLRTEVWSKYFEDSRKGKCIVCVEAIDYDDFQCGHIQSVFYGGSTILTNLEPICCKCNRDMGIMNLNTYKEQLDNELN